MSHSHDSHTDLTDTMVDPAATPTGMIGFLGAILTVTTMLVVTALYYNEKASEIEKVVTNETRLDIAQMKAAQESLLAGPPRWIERVDENGATVSALLIPIDDAIRLVVAEAGR